LTPYPAPPSAPKITSLAVRADKLYWELGWERPAYDSGIGVTSYEVQKAVRIRDELSSWLSIRFQKADELQTLIEIERAEAGASILLRVCACARARARRSLV
jgi:hypothetical protein